MTLMRSAWSPRKSTIRILAAATAVAESAAVVRLSNPVAVDAPDVVVCELLHMATASEFT
jgi:hypothetical protein